MLDQINFFEIKTHWGQLKLARPYFSGGDPWGAFHLLRDSEWYDKIPVVNQDLLERALYGDSVPLERELGPKPLHFLRRLEPEKSWCSHYQEKSCIIAHEKCFIHDKVPDCYKSPDPEVSDLVSALALVWKDNRYFIIVE